jgi:hypothetical protein
MAGDCEVVVGREEGEGKRGKGREGEKREQKIDSQSVAASFFCCVNHYV